MIPGLRRSPGGGHGNPLQYSCLNNLHGQSSWGHQESDTTERLSTARHLDLACLSSVCVRRADLGPHSGSDCYGASSKLPVIFSTVSSSVKWGKRAGLAPMVYDRHSGNVNSLLSAFRIQFDSQSLFLNLIKALVMLTCVSFSCGKAPLSPKKDFHAAELESTYLPNYLYL